MNRRTWSAHNVIATIQDRQMRGLSLAKADNRNLAAAAIARFGSWERALGIAGIVRGKPYGTADVE